MKRSRSTAPTMPSTTPDHEYCQNDAAIHGSGTSKHESSVGNAKKSGSVTSCPAPTPVDAK